MIILVVAGFALDSCNNDNGATIEFHALQITDAELPESFALNNTYEIKVTYVIPDSCTYFEGFDIAPKDSTIREVVAIGSMTINQQCGQVATELQESFLFRVVHEQDYVFKFWQGKDAAGDPIFLEMQVPVN